MDIFQMIKECETDDELRELVHDVILEFTKQAYLENKDSKYIGSDLDYNPRNYHLAEKDFTGEKYCDGVNVWNGYIPKGMKIVYGRFYDDKLKVSTNRGCYYYLDDESYIYDFFKFLKNKDVENEYDLIIMAFSFGGSYFNKEINRMDREDIHKMLYKDSFLLHDPVREHSIKDFKGNGSAMCTEIAVLAENLLSSLGLEIIYVMDKGHAYNIYAAKDSKEVFVLDFSEWVECYDVNFNLIGKTPYMEEIENCTNELIDEVVNHGKRLSLSDYFLYSVNGSIYRIPLNKKRDYGTDFAIEDDVQVLKKRK